MQKVPLSTQSRSKQETSKPFPISISDLSRLRLMVPQQVFTNGAKICVVFTGSANPQVGIISEMPELRPSDDIVKLSQARRVISEGISLSEKKEDFDRSRGTVARVEKEVGSEKIVVPTNFEQQYNMTAKKDDVLKENILKVDSNTNQDPVSKRAKAFLLDQANIILETNKEFVKNLLVSKEKKQYADILFDKGGFKSVMTKLTTNVLDIQPTSNLARILFPANGDSTMKILVKEFRNPTLMGKLAKFDTEAKSFGKYLTKIVQDDTTLELITSIPHDVYSDPLNKETMDLMSTALPYPPIIDQKEYASNFKQITNYGQGKMKFLVTMAIELTNIYAYNFAIDKERAFAQLVQINNWITGFDYSKRTSESVRSQMIAKIGASHFLNLDKTKFLELLSILVDTRRERVGELSKVLDKPILKDDKDLVVKVEFDTFFKPLTDEEKISIEYRAESSAQRSIRPPKPKNYRQMQVNTPLTAEGRYLIKEMKKIDMFRPLVERVSDYLVSFLYQDTQRIAAEMMFALVDKVRRHETGDLSHEEAFWEKTSLIDQNIRRYAIERSRKDDESFTTPPQKDEEDEDAELERRMLAQAESLEKQARTETGHYDPDA